MRLVPDERDRLLGPVAPKGALEILERPAGKGGQLPGVNPAPRARGDLGGPSGARQGTGEKSVRALGYPRKTARGLTKLRFALRRQGALVVGDPGSLPRDRDRVADQEKMHARLLRTHTRRPAPPFPGFAALDGSHDRAPCDGGEHTPEAGLGRGLEEP